MINVLELGYNDKLIKKSVFLVLMVIIKRP